MGSSNYFYEQNGERFGPFSSAELRDLASDGRLRPDARVLKEGVWNYAGQIPELFPVRLPELPLAVVAELEPAEGDSAPSFGHFPPTEPIATRAVSRPKNARRSGFGTLVAVILGGLTSIGLYYTPPMQNLMSALRRVIREEQRAQLRDESEPNGAPAALPSSMRTGCGMRFRSQSTRQSSRAWRSSNANASCARSEVHT